MPWLNAASGQSSKGVRLWGDAMIQRSCGIDPEHEMAWPEYAVTALVLSLVTTFRTDNRLFVALLVGVIQLVGAITFLPADLLGSIIEHFELAHLVTY